MSMYGANPEQLSGLGRSMKQQKTAIDGVDRRGQFGARRHRVGGPGTPAVRERLEHLVQERAQQAERGVRGRRHRLHQPQLPICSG